MLLKRLILTNIKSHKDTTVDFQPGINAIIGDNGSGKSTILESIGAVLFQAVDYKSKEFIRYGEKKGSIELIFEVMNLENKPFELKIVKTFGSNSEYYIEASDQRVDLKEEIIPYLHSIFRIDHSVDLTRLFQDVIGVPQGMQTAHFLLPPASRKKIFDPILNIESYPESVKQLLKVVNYAKNKISESESLIQNYTGQVQDYEDIKLQEKSLKKEESDLENARAISEKLYLKVDEERHKYETQARVIPDKEIAESTIQRLTQEISEDKSELEKLSGIESDIEKLKPKVERKKLVESDIMDLHKKIMIKESYKLEMESAEEIIKSLETQNEHISKKLESYDEVKREADKYEDIDNELERLKIELLRSQHAVEHLEKYSESVEVGNCPILECNCPKEDLKPTFAIMLSDAKNTDELEENITEIRKKHYEAQLSVTELKKLDDLKSELIANLDVIKEKEEQLKNYEENDLKDMISNLHELEDEMEKINEASIQLGILKDNINRLGRIKDSIEIKTTNLQETKSHLEEVNKILEGYDEETHEYVKKKCDNALSELSKDREALSRVSKTLTSVISQRESKEHTIRKKVSEESNLSLLMRVYDKIVEVRTIMKEIPENLVARYLTQINYDANVIFSEITNKNSDIEWSSSYEVIVDKKTFAQLSGGEQMIVALSLRLALLKNITNIDIAIFDEPTVNLDEPHRAGLAEMIQNISGFSQIFVVSHDDTFSSVIENVIQIKKENETSSIV